RRTRASNKAASTDRRVDSRSTGGPLGCRVWTSAARERVTGRSGDERRTASRDSGREEEKALAYRPATTPTGRGQVESGGRQRESDEQRDERDEPQDPRDIS